MNSLRYKFYRFVLLLIFFLEITLHAQHNLQQVSVKKLPFSKPVTCLLTDKAGFLWLGTEEGLYRYDGFDFSLINTISSGELRLSDPKVNSLLEDSLQNLWVATGNGLTVINPSRNLYSHLAVSQDSSSGIRNKIQSLVQSDHMIWCANFQGSIYRIYLAKIKEAFQQKKPIGYQTLKLPGIASEVVGIAAPNGGFWAHHHNQLLHIDSSLSVSKRIKVPENLCDFRFSADKQVVYAANNEGIFTCGNNADSFTYLHRFSLPVYIQESRRRKYLHPSPQGDWWIYGHGGVFERFDPLTGAYQDLSTQFDALNPEKYVNFLSLWQDGPNHLWIGRDDGLFEVTLQEKLFGQLPKPEELGKGESLNPRSIHTLRDSSLLIGSYTGLYRYFPQQQKYISIDFYEPNNPKKYNPLVYDFFEQGDTVYIASESYGLLFYEPANNRLSALQPREAYEKLGEERAIAQWSVAVLKDHAGTIWLGTYGGLMYTNLSDTLAAFRMESKKVFANSWINDLYEDSQYRLWLATSAGLYSIPPHRKSLKRHAVSQLTNLDINAIYPDADSTLWLATGGEGLKHYDPVSGKVQSYTLQDGLPDNVVMSIQPDESGNLWLGTKYGLCSFNIKAKTFYNFFREDGLPDNTFQHNAVGRDLSGLIYLGLSNGIVTVGAANKVTDNHPPIPIITKIVKHDGSENKTYTTLFSSFNQSSIHLDYQDTFFSIYFSVKEFTTQKPQFSYMLEGVSQDWNYLGEQNSLQFAALPPGNYTLSIRARSGKSGWSEKPLLIAVIIEKAFYVSWWAYAVYALAAAGLMYAGFRLYENRKKIQRRWQSEHEHTLKLEELDKAKTRFFTNLAHELRTPLSLIKGPAGKIRQAVTDPKTKGFARQIDRQVDTMLHLIDQMLEIGRIESGSEKLVIVHTDVVPIIQSIAQAFHTLAAQKAITFVVSVDCPVFEMDFDADKLQKILYNLLSNAFKFTPAEGNISLTFLASTDQPDTIALIISDTGIGIEADVLPHIFDRFYQADSSITRAYGGTGIGLSYVKELVTLHNGSIEVESKPEKGTSFRVILPVSQKQAYGISDLSLRSEPAAVNFSSLSQEPVLPDAPQKELPLVLVIEDHRELAGFIASCLEGMYRVVCAFDGVEGYELAVGQVPDLVITDLMMPKLDGLSLMRQLKTHQVTGHIPLVMLTAKSTQTEKLTGLEGGADAYITKPFAVEELLLTLRNLLQLRDKIAKNFSQTYSGETKSEPAWTENGTAHVFLTRFTQIVEENLSNENFGVNELLLEIGMSRTQLHRKLKALCGQSAHGLMRNIKMQKALHLLRSTSLPIAHVAMQVGFGNASHFTKIFVEHNGFLPSTVREKSGNN